MVKSNSDIYMNDYVHKAGNRKEKEISFYATAENFLEGCRFNDSLHALAAGKPILIPKGVYFFRTHAEADQQRMDYLVRAIAATESKNQGET